MTIKTTMMALGLIAATYAGATKYEAEEATTGGDAAKKDTYVDLNEGSITFANVTAEAAGNYTLTIHTAAPYGEKDNNITVNGTQVGSFHLDKGTAFIDVSTIISLKAGNNTIGITKSWGWIQVDYIEVKPFEVGSFDLCNAPTTKDATASAVKLYNFLVNNFGKKTISGVMTGDMTKYTKGDATQHEDVQAVYTASGKYPALVGVDLMNATGANKNDSWNKDYTQKSLDIAKSIWTKGGIPAITWHWRPGSEAEFYVKGANEKYTEFDFTEAFMTGTTTWDTLSTAYQALVADIDLIAGYMLELQDAGVAAIFRPLHESGGAWFWWSTHTGTQFAALYRLVYERLVFKKGVKNLVWVFNPKDANMTGWDPGSTYYDVRGVDIYNDANNHTSNSSAFFDLMTKFGTDKVLALSENGPIPDVTNMHTDQAVWSWWMPWYESPAWNGGYVSQTAASVWKSNMENENIITLDKMPGWASYSVANSGTKTCNTATETSKYNGDKDKAAGNSKNYLMQVSLSKLGKDGALINYTKLPDLTNSKSISVKISTKGSGATNGGVWIGLAFVRDGSADKEWTWEQSTSDGCWIEEGSSKTCEFEITTYVGEDKKEHPIDLDNLFSVAFNISAEGFSGNIGFDEMVTDNGLIISNFDKTADLFAISDGSEKVITGITMVEKLADPSASTPTSSSSKTNPASSNSNKPNNGSGNNTAIGAGALPAVASLTLQGSSLSFTTARAASVSLDVFDLQGNKVMGLYKGALSAGTHQFSLSGMARGSYIVRANGMGIAATQKVVIR